MNKDKNNTTMKRTMLSSLIFSGMLAFNASAADFGGRLTVEDATIVPGQSAVLSIQLDNDIDVSGFQLQMLLPTGIVYQSWAISEERLPVGASAKDVLSMQRFAGSKLTIAGALNFGAGAKFTNAQGELATVTLTDSPNLPEGTYLVEVRAIDICDPQGKDYDVPSTTFTLTVGEPSGIETLRGESSNASVYDLQGRRQSEASVGQAAVVNGRVVYHK